MKDQKIPTKNDDEDCEEVKIQEKPTKTNPKENRTANHPREKDIYDDVLSNHFWI